MTRAQHPATRFEAVEDARQGRALMSEAGMQVIDARQWVLREIGEDVRLRLRQPDIAELALNPERERMGSAFQRGSQSRRVMIIHTNMYTTKTYNCQGG